MPTATLVSRACSPAFAHDCASCRFLGSLDGQDLYACPEDGGSYVRRFGPSSGDYGTLGGQTPAGTAYAFAKELDRRGLKPARYARKGG